jgi:hypothetical protein
MKVSPTGETEISVKGVKGKSCKALTKNLEEALGGVSKTTETREFHESEQTRVQHRGRA